MNTIHQIKIDLDNFIKVDRFIEFQHLQPAVANSTTETKTYVNREMFDCCNELLLYVENENPTDDGLKQIVRNSLERTEEAMLDTEDREFCYELYHVIGNILGVNIQDESIDLAEKMLSDIHKMLKKAGLNPDDFMLGK